MSDVFHWQDESGAWQLARKVNESFRWQYIGCTATGDKYETECLVQHLYSNRLEWVPESKLKPYPESPIPEPK